MSSSREFSTDSFLLLHGWEHHKPEGHWLAWLAAELERIGARVRYPQLPDADKPDLTEWVRVIGDELAELDQSAVTVICHSLSAVTWLHAAANIDAPLARVVLVAPPSPQVLARIPEICDFAVTGFSQGMIAALATVPTLIAGSDNDPYCPEGAETCYGAPLGVDFTVLPGAGHVDLDAGYGDWPAMLDWCRHPGSALSVTHRVAR